MGRAKANTVSKLIKVRGLEYSNLKVYEDTLKYKSFSGLQSAIDDHKIKTPLAESLKLLSKVDYEIENKINRQPKWFVLGEDVTMSIATALSEDSEIYINWDQYRKALLEKCFDTLSNSVKEDLQIENSEDLYENINQVIEAAEANIPQSEKWIPNEYPFTYAYEVDKLMSLWSIEQDWPDVDTPILQKISYLYTVIHFSEQEINNRNWADFEYHTAVAARLINEVLRDELNQSFQDEIVA